MSKPSLPRPKVPRVTAHSRRQQYSASTRRALVDTAEKLFTENGYAATSLDTIVAGTRVTKGALYHHFNGKADLFQAVFERVEERASKSIKKALRSKKNPWDKGAVGLRAFLQVVQSPAYRRIVMQEGPAVMGYTRFREQEERKTFDLIAEIVGAIMEDSNVAFDQPMLDTFTQIFFGAMSAAGESVSESADPATASARVETAMAFIMSGLRHALETAAPETESAPPAVEAEDAEDAG